MGSILAPSLATVAAQFLSRSGLAKSTVRSYESALMPLLAAYGGWPIDILERAELQAYLEGLTHLAYTTQQKHQTTLQALFNFAVEQEYLKANPIARLRRRKPDAEQGEHGSDEEIRYLSPEQLEWVYRAVADDGRMLALVRLLHRTGARISEVLQLDLEDIDFEAQRFQVVGKGNKKRWCFFSEDAAMALGQYIRLYRHLGISALFTAQQPFTLQVSRLSYRRAHECWCELIAPFPELSGARLHDLRHTFATERVGLMGIEELRALITDFHGINYPKI